MARKPQPPWHLPVTVYTLDSKSQRYMLSGCLHYRVPMRPFPATLDCSSAQTVLRDNVQLLKSALQAPAIVLVNGHKATAFGSSGDPWPLMPAMHDARHRLIRAFEMQCVNLTAAIVHYRLRVDGRLVLSGAGDVNCGTCYVPESMSLRSLKHHLHSRGDCIKKTLRDRRLIVEIGGDRACVYSVDTMQRMHVIGDEQENKSY